MSQPIRILVIAYGNPLRRDDGAGLVLADRLTQRWQAKGIAVQQLTTHQLVPELVAEIAESHATAVVFVDATPVSASAAAESGIQIHSLDDEAVSLTIGHHVDPGLIKYMAESLYGVESPAWLVTIAGTDFGHGEGFSGGMEELLARSDFVASEIETKLSGHLTLTPIHNVGEQENE